MTKSSRQVRVHGPATAKAQALGASARRSRQIQTRTYGPKAIDADQKRVEEERAQLTAGLSSQHRRAFADMRGDDSMALDVMFNVDDTIDDVSAAMADPTSDNQPSEDDPVAQALRDLLDARPDYRKHKDSRTWKQRIEAMDARWNKLLPSLVDAYLRWKGGSNSPPSASEAGTERDLDRAQPMDIEPVQRAAEAAELASDPPVDQQMEPAPAPLRGYVVPGEEQPLPVTNEDAVVDPAPLASAPGDYSFTVDCLDIDTLATSVHIARNAHQRTAEAVVLAGYLPPSPDQPTIVVALKTLEWLRQLKIVKASFSIEAFTKLICNKYTIPYQRRYRKAIADAFDVYLTICQVLDARVASALGRDEPDWRARHSCAACSYKVEGETTPEFSRMIVMDGNNSLKRMATTGNRQVGDTRMFSSDYILPRAYVDSFANEVKSRPREPHVPVPEGEDNSLWVDDPGSDGNHDPTEGDPTDGDPDLSSCASNWKAAAADEKKRTWAIFDETGVFVAACSHGFVLWLVDMVRSGELAKYSLTITDKALKVIVDRILLAFDIGCSFKTTLANSSIGADFKKSGSRVCVNAFHGYSHAYPCQLQNHPNVIKGIGLEDLETLERIFSSSNQLAPVVRYASAYRRHALIDLFFKSWDHEKHANLGLFLYNNYRQAISILDTLEPAVEESMKSLKLTRNELHQLEHEEREYFANLQDEAPWDLHAIAYVEALQDLRSAQNDLDVTSARFRANAPSDYQWAPPTSRPTEYDVDLSATRKLETKRRTLQDTVTRLTHDVHEMELSLGITQRWQPTDTEYQETMKYIATRRYQRALGRLQRLVIQRLFELHKLNVARTAYRVRTHIAKSLQKRCRAIRNAVKAYNDAALALDPPRAVLNWSEISDFNFLEEVTLLSDTRNDIREKLWAKPLVRETMRSARRLDRAREEITRVHREATRVHTSVRDEELLFTQVLSQLQADGDPLYAVLNEHCARRRAANAQILAHLRRLYRLPGYDGSTEPGVHAGPSRERVVFRAAPRAEDATDLPEVADHSPKTGPSFLSDTAPPSREGDRTSPSAGARADQPSEDVDDLLAQLTLDEEEVDAIDDEEARQVSALFEHMADIAAVM